MNIPLRWKVYPNPMRGDGVFVGSVEVESYEGHGLTDGGKSMPVVVLTEGQIPRDLADYVVDALNAYGEALRMAREDLRFVVMPTREPGPVPASRVVTMLLNYVLPQMIQQWYTKSNDPRPDPEDTRVTRED